MKWTEQAWEKNKKNIGSIPTVVMNLQLVFNVQSISAIKRQKTPPLISGIE